MAIEKVESALQATFRKQYPDIVKTILATQPMTAPHNTRYWPHQHCVEFSRIAEVERWCYANLKTKNWRNQAQFFAFKRDRDFALFMLRWA